MVLEAQKNDKFKKTLNNTALNIPDGIGILWAAKYLDSVEKYKSKTFKILRGIVSLPTLLTNPKKFRGVLPEKITGTDLMQKICKELPKTPIFLLGASEEVAKKTAEILQKKYKTNIVGTDSGSASSSNDKNLQKKINASKAEIIFVAFGAPKQELWIERNLPYLETVNVAMGIGGAFNFISGEIKRAPKFMRKLGLEWLWRLGKQPGRIVRIYNAVVRFPKVVIKKSFNKKS